MSYRLVLGAKGRDEARPLRGTSLCLGRDPSSDVVIHDEDRTVGRRHARLDFDGRHWRVVDLESTNRVRVNGEFIPPGEAGARTLSDGDVILLGNYELSFVREDSESIVLERDGLAPGLRSSRSAVGRLEDLSALLDPRSRASLGREASDWIERASQALSVVSAVGRRIAAVTPSDDIIDAIVDLVFQATPAERAALFLVEAETGRIVPKLMRTRAGAAGEAMEVSESLVQEAFLARAVVQLDPDVRTSRSISRLGLRSALAVPLLAEPRVVGVIYADTSVASRAFDAFNVTLLSALASHAAIALEQTRLLRKARQEERNRAKLEQYLAPGVVNRILASSDSSASSPGLAMRADEADVTVLFCDMAGFTSRTEDMAPQEVLSLLNRCFSQMTEVIHQHEGTLDKYIGDCIMAVFGAPQTQPDHARRAALSALGLRGAVRRINADGGPEIDFRIGIHSGRVVAGDVGHVTRRNWTVLGSTVNLASRLENFVARPGQIVLSGETRERLGDEFDTCRLALSGLPKGISRSFEAYELVSWREPTAKMKPVGR
jgi:adenylate cyclase